ncbi:hypothetical protein [Rhodobacter lacus]|uniref:Uncharacterized protein n=1 Tax=Rhodobacter lacus TaxID=1641972 RepID=A0ABW5AC01_9RHOB
MALLHDLIGKRPCMQSKLLICRKKFALLLLQEPLRGKPGSPFLRQFFRQCGFHVRHPSEIFPARSQIPVKLRLTHARVSFIVEQQTEG